MSSLSITVDRVSFPDIEVYHEEYRRAATCQIIRDSILPRGLADPYILGVNDEVAGYAGVWNRHWKDRIMEVFVAPRFLQLTDELFRCLVAASGATHLEAQTNLPGEFSLLQRFVAHPIVENLLFQEGRVTDLACPGGTFRSRSGSDRGVEGEWVVERDGAIIGAGGILTHYNPPFGDLYMEVVPAARGQGVGAFVIQELRRCARERGLIPAARCDATNVASQRTLERGGMLLCGQLLSGRLDLPIEA